MPCPPECVEDGIVEGTCERLLSIGRNGICCDAFLSLRAQIAPSAQVSVRCERSAHIPEIYYSAETACFNEGVMSTYMPFFGSGPPPDRSILVACILKAGVTLIVAVV